MLVNPGVAVVDARGVSGAVGGVLGGRLAFLGADGRDAVGSRPTCERLRNDLQAAACSLAPVIGDVLDALAAVPGCLLARMSGSGATCFGLFASAGAAARGRRRIRRAGWWVWGGAIEAVDRGFPLYARDRPTYHARSWGVAKR